jgi:UDP-N-acetylmuramoylalanine--D-glutamate ligase
MALEVEGKRVTVVGFGRSGQAATRLLLHRGARATVTDRRSIAELEGLLTTFKEGAVQFQVGGHPQTAFQNTDLIVMSPGISVESVDAVQAARARGVPVIGEMELGFGFAKAPIVAITGTNGKSTTTALTGEILKAPGHRVFVGGNLGRPLCEAVLERTEWDWIVVEVSSFQLETIRTFRPRVSALLNVTPNHLDRYRGFEDYLAAKMRIFENQTADDLAVVNADDPLVLKRTDSIRSRRVFISRRPRTERGVYLKAGRVIAVDAPGHPDRVEILRQEEIPLQGSHNIENILAASAVGLVCGCAADQIRKVVRGFKGLEHRLEPVRKRKGVLYVNDSKATTVAALAKALEAFSEPIVLIAGGRDKGGEFTLLRDLVRDRVKVAVLIGEARPTLRAAWGDLLPIIEVKSLEEAVERAAGEAASGDVVLLSPACSSFDMFRDFEDRGRCYKEAVNRL